MNLTKKEALIIFLLFVILVGINISIVSALPESVTKMLAQAKKSFFGEGNLLTGFATTRQQNVTAAITNIAPVVDEIAPIVAQSITEDSTTGVSVSFVVFDGNGVSDLTDSTANATIYIADGIFDGGESNTNTSCSAETDINSTHANYTCTMQIHYWFNATEWNITAGILDASSISSINTSNFTIQETTAIVIEPEGVTFPSLTTGAENTTSDNDPIIINNTGNDNIDENNTLITGLDLVGQTTSTEAITAENFTIGTETGGSPTLECNVTQLVNNTATNINASLIYAGNRSISGAGIENLYVCINLVPTISSQTYSATGPNGAWTVSVI